MTKRIYVVQYEGQTSLWGDVKGSARDCIARLKEYGPVSDDQPYETLWKGAELSTDDGRAWAYKVEF